MSGAGRKRNLLSGGPKTTGRQENKSKKRPSDTNREETQAKKPFSSNVTLDVIPESLDILQGQSSSDTLRHDGDEVVEDSLALFQSQNSTFSSSRQGNRSKKRPSETNHDETIAKKAFTPSTSSSLRRSQRHADVDMDHVEPIEIVKKTKLPTSASSDYNVPNKITIRSAPPGKTFQKALQGSHRN